MSDNVVLSKHFDSLASAIQRCLSAGYAPTAYIPAGHESVIDNVASTVDGGMWYVAEGSLPVLKMHYGDYDFIVNLSIPREAAHVFDLHADPRRNPPYYDTCDNTWTIDKGGFSNIGLDVLTPLKASNPTIYAFNPMAKQTLTRDGNVTLGNKDFALGFWHSAHMNANTTHSVFLHFYDATGEDILSVFEDYNYHDNKNYSAHGITFAGTTYNFPEVQVPDGDSTVGVHAEFNYSYSTNELKFFYNGSLVSTLGANLPTVTSTRQVIGRPDGVTSYDFYIAEVQLYNGLALHLDDFTPTYTAAS